MTIRLQNLLAIPPIFLILGLVTGAMAYRAAYNEILWGLNEEAVSMAVTVAEMMDRGSFENGAPEAALAAVGRSMDRLAIPGRAASIVVFSGADGSVLLSRHVDPAAAELEGAMWQRYGAPVQSDGDPAAGSVTEWGPYAKAIVAAAPVVSRQQALLGVVGVVIDAGRMDLMLGDVRRHFLIGALLVTLLGTIAALFLSVSFGRQVSALGQVASSVAAGDYRAQTQVEGVKEVNDLFNTLRTMSSILQDVLTRGRRALVVGDPFQVAHGVALGYRSARHRGLPSYATLEVGVAQIGDPQPGFFFGSTQVDDRTLFWVGETRVENELDRAVESAAVDRFLSKRLVKHAPDAVLEEAIALFRLSSLQVAWVDAGDPEPSLEVRDPVGSGVPVVDSGTLALHTFPSDSMKSLRRALAVFSGVSAEQVGEELHSALPRDASGVVLIVHLNDLKTSRRNAS